MHSFSLIHWHTQRHRPAELINCVRSTADRLVAKERFFTLSFSLCVKHNVGPKSYIACFQCVFSLLFSVCSVAFAVWTIFIRFSFRVYFVFSFFLVHLPHSMTNLNCVSSFWIHFIWCCTIHIDTHITISAADEKNKPLAKRQVFNLWLRCARESLRATFHPCIHAMQAKLNDLSTIHKINFVVC